jgi:hypothetical protein
MNKTHMVDQRKAPKFQVVVFNSNQGLFHFTFEFEYRKHRTIKGDANR